MVAAPVSKQQRRAVVVVLLWLLFVTANHAEEANNKGQQYDFVNGTTTPHSIAAADSKDDFAPLSSARPNVVLDWQLQQQEPRKNAKRRRRKLKMKMKKGQLTSAGGFSVTGAAAQVFSSSVNSAASASSTTLALDEKKNDANGGRKKKKKKKSNNKRPKTTATAAIHNKPQQQHAVAPRIVGGSDATSPDEFPWFVLAGGCGGSLVWQDVIMTAAHCLNAVSPPHTHVWVGAWDRLVPQNHGHYQKIHSSDYRVHPDYNHVTNEWDVLLVKIDPVPGVHVRTLDWNVNPQIPANGQLLTAIGFGRTNETTASSTRLRKVEVPAISPMECNTILYPGKVKSDSMICAGYAEGGKDSCQGDSGGPLLDVNSQTQVGIVSFGYGCAQPNKPGVYTRISAVQDFIESSICELSSSSPKPDRCNQEAETESGTGPVLDSEEERTTMTFRIDVQYDLYPHEFKWFIRDKTTRKKIASMGYNTVDKAHAFYSADLQLEPGGHYELAMRDEHGDGICCGAETGRGYVDVFASQDGIQQRLLGVWGDFTFKSKTRFQVPKQIEKRQAQRTNGQAAEGSTERIHPRVRKSGVVHVLPKSAPPTGKENKL